MTLLTMIVKMGEGLSKTCAIFSLTLLFSLPLGMIVALLRMSKSKIISGITRFFISILRGTPLMLQLMVVFYGPKLLLGVTVPGNWRFTAVIVAFVINYAAYFSEIYRGGIESIPVGQYEAGQVLGLTKTQTFFKVVLFQVVKRIMAPMSNEVITLVKDTSLANVIAVGELIMSAQNIVKVYAIIWPLFYTAIFYLIFCGVLTLLFNALEKKLNYYRG